MIEIDGSIHSGSGILLRYAMALATLTGEPLHMTRIRTKREKPGLRPQHLQVVRACSAFSGGELSGAEVGSQEILYRPGKTLRSGGDFHWDIGTAGSTTMLAFTLIPLALFSQGRCRFTLIGGLFQDFAPSVLHMERILIPLLRRMGAQIQLKILTPGDVPKGQGHLFLEVEPLRDCLRPLIMLEQEKVGEFRGVSLSSHLEKEMVSERMAAHCQELLKERGYQARMEILHDRAAPQRRAALFLAAETDQGCLLGADQAGKPGRRSEAIAEFEIRSFLEDLTIGATTDRHMADQLILFAALARGTTEYRIPRMTDHVESNLYLVEKILGAQGHCQGTHLQLEGSGFQKSLKEGEPWPSG